MATPLDEARRRAQQLAGTGATAQPQIVPPQPQRPTRQNPPASGGVTAAPPNRGGYNAPESRRAVVDAQNRTMELAARGNAADAERRRASGGGRGPTGGGGRDGAPVQAPRRNPLDGVGYSGIGRDDVANARAKAGPAARRPPFDPNWQDPSKPSNVPRQINWNPAAKDVPSLAGTWNGRQITRNEADELASKVNTVPAAAFGQGAQRRTNVMPGYRGANLRPSRGPSVDDKYQLARDLSTLGRGSPTARAALFARYNDQANNAERGQNNLAGIDLDATARSADNFADRSQDADQFDKTYGLEEERLGIQSRESGSRMNVYEEMRKNAAALREADLNENAGRPSEIEKMLDGTREQLEAQGEAPEEIAFKLAQARQRMQTDGYDTPTEAINAINLEGDVRDVFSPDNRGWKNAPLAGVGDDVNSAWSARAIEDGQVDPELLGAPEQLGWWRDTFLGPGKQYKVKYGEGEGQSRYIDEDQAEKIRRAKSMLRRPAS